MGHHHACKPKRLKRRADERRNASHHAIQRATFQHLMAPVDDPDHPGSQVSYAELEQRLRARSYQQAVALQALHDLAERLQNLKQAVAKG